MTIDKQYEEIIKEKRKIDELLTEHTWKTISDLCLRFARTGNLKKLFMKDNQLLMLECFCTIWISEQKKMSGLGVMHDIFESIHSLADVEEKYISIWFGALRIECLEATDACLPFVDYIVENHVSGIALHYIIKRETMNRKHNTLILAHLLKERKEHVTAVILLQESEADFPGDADILLLLADCWMEGGQWQQAYECLKRIKKPVKSIKELMEELKKALKYEIV